MTTNLPVEFEGEFKDIAALLYAIKQGDLAENSVLEEDLNTAIELIEEENDGSEHKCLFYEKVSIQ